MSKFELSRLNREFQAIKERFPGLFNGKMVLGVSGGADSMSLLYLLHRNQIDTVAVHCNYQVRGKSSDQDQQLVEEVCSLWNIDCVSVRLNPKESEGQNFQAWARDERYRIFREIKVTENANLILTAHHEDDQIETILQKMLRGSGIGSWKGMDLLDGDLLRPLLKVSKSEIMEFVQKYHVPYRIDSSNEESTYARNFIRNNWFPELNTLFPGWKENLMRIQDRSVEFEKMADQLLSYLTEGEYPDCRLKRKEFLQLDRALWPVVMHRYLQRIDSGLDISRGFLSHIQELENLQTGKSIQITDNTHLVRDRSFFVIEKSSDNFPIGSTEIIIDDSISESRTVFGEIEISAETWDQKIREHIIQLDYDKLKFPLTFRKWKEGDRIKPLGMKGSQLISDHLTNVKIPAVEKKGVKVLTSFDGIVYAVIFPTDFQDNKLGTIAETAKCDSQTKKILILRNT